MCSECGKRNVLLAAMPQVFGRFWLQTNRKSIKTIPQQPLAGGKPELAMPEV